MSKINPTSLDRAGTPSGARLNEVVVDPYESSLGGNQNRYRFDVSTGFQGDGNIKGRVTMELFDTASGGSAVASIDSSGQRIRGDLFAMLDGNDGDNGSNDIRLAYKVTPAVFANGRMEITFAGKIADGKQLSILSFTPSSNFLILESFFEIDGKGRAVWIYNFNVVA